VEATKVTGDGNVPAGSVAFKVPIGAKHADTAGMHFGAGTAFMDVYKGQGRVARANNVDARYFEPFDGRRVCLQRVSACSFGEGGGELWGWHCVHGHLQGAGQGALWQRFGRQVP